MFVCVRDGGGGGGVCVCVCVGGVELVHKG